MTRRLGGGGERARLNVRGLRATILYGLALAVATVATSAYADLIEVRASGTITGINPGLDAAFAQFSMPPPLNTLTGHEPWLVCVVYESTTPESESLGNTRRFAGAIVSVDVIVNGHHVSSVPADPDFIYMANTDFWDEVSFRFGDLAPATREFSGLLALLDTTLVLFPGTDNTGIPTSASVWSPGDFNVISMRIEYVQATDIARANISGFGSLASLYIGPVIDCNGNSTSDACDIAGGTSQDCNSNDIPDECEADSDSDGVIDDCDACPGFDDALDCDNDGTPDGCEPDCDADGTPDDCEVDCDGNNVPDDCDLADATVYDCDCNGLIDQCEIDDDPSLDLNGSGFLDSCERCPDINCDGVVWISDLFAVLGNFGQTGVNKADVNFDGIVNFADYLYVLFRMPRFCGW